MMSVMGILGILGCLLCLTYGAVIALVSAFSLSSAWWIWPGLGLLFLTLPVYAHIRRLYPGQVLLPDWLRVFLITSLLLFATVFCIVEAQIIGAMTQEEPELKPRYLIVLGGKVNGTEPSAMLKERLDAAIDYWQENSSVRVIVSGGQGSNERYSEAAVMAYYLANNGIPVSYIETEEESSDTEENIRYSATLLYSKNVPVAIVTTNFHMYRALRLAQKQGLTNVSGITTPCETYLLPHYLVREFLAVVKDYLYGNI